MTPRQRTAAIRCWRVSYETPTAGSEQEKGPDRFQSEPYTSANYDVHLQQSAVQPPSQQLAAQSPLQQSPEQQLLHLSVQQAGQQSDFAFSAELWANALIARTTETESTASIRFISNLLSVQSRGSWHSGLSPGCSSAARRSRSDLDPKYAQKYVAWRRILNAV